ncbi:piggyBac transposable element-derived protein 4-like [Argopecten irradians]|uniref:piggyBac transposable element-derived protein 4-like n=1 Tax=Argopecten irradians TaxID=31199 RepID=UPI0037227307
MAALSDTSDFGDSSSDEGSERDDPVSDMSDLDMDDDLSDHSFQSDTDSDDDPDTCSSMGTLGSQASSVDSDFWSDELKDVDTTDFTETAGPRHDLPPTASVLMFFFLMFSDTFFSTMMEETNRYAAQRQETHPDPDWYDTTIPEMMAFIGMQIMMGVVQVPNLGIYWSSNPFLGNAGFQRVMSRNRFQDLQRYFHLSDNTTQPPRGDPRYDRLNKVRPVIDMARANFRERYQPGQHQSVDEGMVKYKGQYFAKQYMPAKPVKRGFKIWMRCESSGYCGDFRPYLGKHDQFRGRDLGARVVLHLCRPLKWKGHHVYFDRFFTSIHLVQKLLANGIFACGTIKATSAGIPASMVAPTGLDRGDTVQCQHDDLVLTVWKDKKLVHVVSSGCHPVGDDPVVRRIPGGGAAEFNRPPTITQYQRYMGGVDRCMQHRAKNPVGRPAKKYWKYLLNFILELCLINAFQVWKETPGATATKRTAYKLLDFRCDVATELIGGFTTRKLPMRLTAPVHPAAVHTISRLDRKRSTCKWCTKHGEKRRRDTQFGCSMCDVHLCQGACFTSYHDANHMASS